MAYDYPELRLGRRRQSDTCACACCATASSAVRSRGAVKRRSNTVNRSAGRKQSSMLRLQLLGTLSIEHAAGQSTHASSVATTDTAAVPLNGAAVQRRPLALLAFLATAREAGRSREEVLLHLWPDSTPARARNVLKQTLYTLRRDLHAPDVVLTHGDRYRLNPAVITSDVAELEAAIERGDVARALALHWGPFLDGFSLGD